MPSKNSLATIKSILRMLVPLGVGFFLVWQIYTNWQQVAVQLRDTYPIFLILAFVVNILLYPLAALSFHIILRTLNQKITFIKSFKIWILANFAKYIPGTVWQYLGRIELARQESIPRPVTLAALVYEVLTYLAAGVIWVLFYFQNTAVISSLMVVLIFVLLLPKIIGIIRTKIARFREMPDTPLPPKTLVTLLAVNFFDFFVTGLAIWLLLAAFGPPTLDPIRLTAIYAFSWIVGYITFIAPGGLGVADATLAGLLAPHLGIGFASLVAILLRLIILGNELLLGALVWKQWRKQK